MKIKGAIFDMDGTLIDSLTFWEQYWKKLGREYLNEEELIPDPALDCEVRTLTFRAAQLRIKEFYGLSVSDEELAAFSEKGVISFYEHEVAVKDGAFAFLEHLKNRGIKRCIASATEKPVILHALSHLGLDKYFDTVLSCADIGKSKDHPDIYLLAKDALGEKESELCVFEDSFVAIETAKKAGFLTVGIFDEHNFNQERLAASSDIYLAKGRSMAELIEQIDR